MKKRKNIIILISIVVCIATGIFMFNENSELQQKLEHTQSSEEVSLAKKNELLKDTLVSIGAGGAIYVIFYAIPHEYELAQEERRKKIK